MAGLNTTANRDDYGASLQNKPLSNNPAGGMNYTPRFNDRRVAVNPGNVLARQAKESQFVPQFGTQTGKQAAADLSKSQQMNDSAQTARAISSQNAQQGTKDSISRIQLMQQGRANAAKIYQDIGKRENDQMGMALQLRMAQINNNAQLKAAALQAIQR